MVNGNTLTYDAENRLSSVTEPASLGGASETIGYDDSGQRVLKSTGSGSSYIYTWYVYDIFGQLAAEYSNGPQASSPCSTCYLTADHLGSTRVVTDEHASVVSLHDYLPFGEEVTSGFAGRTGLFGNPDSVNQKFTGKERDSESGLDYFGARYYGSALGGSTSPDPIVIMKQKLLDPQLECVRLRPEQSAIADDWTGMYLRQLRRKR